jgi:hypothetical protein
MPLGSRAPTFSPDKLADAMESAVQNLPEMREAIKNYNFKSWSGVCDSILEDLLSLKA